jgi:hypothetical protein
MLLRAALYSLDSRFREMVYQVYRLAYVTDLVWEYHPVVWSGVVFPSM